MWVKTENKIFIKCIGTTVIETSPRVRRPNYETNGSRRLVTWKGNLNPLFFKKKFKLKNKKIKLKVYDDVVPSRLSLTTWKLRPLRLLEPLLSQVSPSSLQTPPLNFVTSLSSFFPSTFSLFSSSFSLVDFQQFRVFSYFYPLSHYSSMDFLCVAMFEFDTSF